MVPVSGIYPTLIDTPILPPSLCTMTPWSTLTSGLKPFLTLPVSLHNDLTMVTVDDWLQAVPLVQVAMVQVAWLCLLLAPDWEDIVCLSQASGGRSVQGFQEWQPAGQESRQACIPVKPANTPCLNLPVPSQTRRCPWRSKPAPQAAAAAAAPLRRLLSCSHTPPPLLPSLLTKPPCHQTPHSQASPTSPPTPT